MADYETLNIVPDRGGSRDTKKRGTVTEFDDGYKQEVITGLRKVSKTVAFSYTGDYATCSGIENFFDEHATTSFYFRFMPQEPARLYKVQEGYQLTHEGGLKWRISATFYESMGL